MSGLPFPIIHSMRYDIPYYHNNGFDFIFTQRTFRNIGTYGLNYYIAAKLAWDVHADANDILNEFYNEFYGQEAGSYMKKYFVRLEDAAIDSNLELAPKYYGAFLDLFSDPVLTDCRGFLNDAKSSAQGDELLLKRIELSDISLTYTEKVIDYLKEIKGLLSDIDDNKLLCRTFTEEESAKAKAMSEEIKEFVLQVEPYLTINQTKYIDRLLSFNNAVKGIRSYLYGETYTKGHWLRKNDKTAQPGYCNWQSFDIWLYANDIDYRPVDPNTGAGGPEHQISAIDKFGVSIELGRIARSGPEEGNKKDKGFILSDFSCEDLVEPNGSINLNIFNFPGNQWASTFYAIAIMPHIEDIDQDMVTWYYENDPDYIREHSFGFIEFSEKNRDNEILEVKIDLYSTVPMDLPEGWSMISLPLKLYSVVKCSELFPDAVILYGYENEVGYVRVREEDKLEVGRGYWILMDQNQSYLLTGQPVQLYTLPVYDDGWAMIGGYTCPAQALSDNSSIVVIYGYVRGKGYQRISESEIEPGKGYWIFFNNVMDQAELRVEVTV